VLSEFRRRLTYANVMATIAVFVAVGGSSYAALRVGSKQIVNNSVRSADIRNNDVRGKDVRNNTLTGADVRDLASGDVTNGGLLAEDFAPGQLPAGPPGPPGRDGVNGAANVTYRRTVSGTAGQGGYATRAARCQPGERLIGGGAGWAYPNERYHESGRLSASAPGVVSNEGLQFVRPIAEGETPNVWFGAGENNEVQQSELVVYAICATP
jgi:hypothetical protein